MTARGSRPGSRLVLRRARAHDAPAIARVMRAAVAGEAGRYPARDLAAWGSLPPLYHRWAMTAGGETYLLAERAGRLVGYAAWRAGEVTALFVRPSAAGRGLGTRLFTRAEAAACRGAKGRLTLLAARAVAPFYAAHGWRAVGPERSPLPGGRSLPAVRMVKPA